MHILLDIVAGLITAITAIHGNPVVLVEEENYSRIRMADSCFVEVVTYKDSILVVETVCAPICASRARIYNKEWQILHDVPATVQGIFPYAEQVNAAGIIWRDNTPQMLDEEEQQSINY